MQVIQGDSYYKPPEKSKLPVFKNFFSGLVIEPVNISRGLGHRPVMSGAVLALGIFNGLVVVHPFDGGKSNHGQRGRPHQEQIQIIAKRAFAIPIPLGLRSRGLVVPLETGRSLECVHANRSYCLDCCHEGLPPRFFVYTINPVIQMRLFSVPPILTKTWMHEEWPVAIFSLSRVLIHDSIITVVNEPSETMPLSPLPPIKPVIAPRPPRFGTLTTKPEVREKLARAKEKAPWFIYRPFVRLSAFIGTHPRLIQKYFARPRRNYLSPAYFKCVEPREFVTFSSVDGKRLQGYWLPESTGKSTKTVILGHGYTADWRTMAGLAIPMREAGFNVFLFDYRGHGKSSGNRTTFGLDEGKDLAGAVDFVKQEFSGKAQSLFYYGQSMGGATVMLTPMALTPRQLQTMTDKLDAIVSDAPYASAGHFLVGKPSDKPKRVPIYRFVTKLWRLLGPIKKHIQTQALKGLRVDDKKWLKLSHHLHDMRPGAVMADSPLADKPFMLIHGDADTTTPYEAGLENYRALGGESRKNIEFVTLKGVDHCGLDWKPFDNSPAFTSCVRGNQQAFAQRIIDFFNAHLNEGQP